ncbi:MAG: hypothetical protein WCP69_04855 [Bacteroidota bacterium]
MTYIVAGKLSSCTCLMADCIVNRTGDTPIFTDKIRKLTSSDDTFFSVTGNCLIPESVEILDMWLFSLGRPNDFISGNNSITDLVKLISWRFDKYHRTDGAKLDNNRIFFINRDSVIYYNLFYNENNLLTSNLAKTVLQNKKQITNMSPHPISFDLISTSNPLRYCKSVIDDLAKSENKDLKDRFSYIQLNSDSDDIIISPFKKISDIVAAYEGADYNLLDDISLSWDEIK